MSQPTDQLIDFIAHCRFEDLPPSVVEYSKIVLLDSIICGIAAGPERRSQMLAKVYQDMGGVAESTIFGSSQKVPAANAAAANAEAMNLLDADDTFFTSAHFAAFNAAACVAESERSACSGRDLIRAMALGYDVNARIALSQVSIIEGENGRLEYSPVQGMGYAAFGTAISSALIRGMSAESLRRMMGVVGWLAPTPSCNPAVDRVEHHSFKYANYAGSAQAGMLAVAYTEAGYSSQNDILDSGAFMRAQGCLDTDLALLTEQLGDKWWIEDSCIKYYPSCRYTSAPIDMLLQLMEEQKLQPEDIDSIDIEMSSVAYAMQMFRNPATSIADNDRAPLNGSFNIPYIIACAALGYRPGPLWYSSERLADQKVWDFAARVSTSENPHSYEATKRALATRIRRFKANPSSMTVRAKGLEYNLSSEYADGDPWLDSTRPNWEKMSEKFHNFCGHLMEPCEIDALISYVRDLEHCDHVQWSF